MKRIIFLIWVGLLLLAPALVEAGKKSAPAGPTAAQQQAFTQRFWQAVDAGGDALQKLSQEVTGKAGAQGEMETRMLHNLQKGKAADGGEAKGFHGDPNDPGPQDWSDWNIETDADGNVTGFKEKDHYQKDLDGDGQVTEQEARDYEMKRADQFMDKDGDGTVSDKEKKAAAEEMDTNKDGEVDEEELDQWNDKKAEEKEAKDNGGQAPGQVDRPPDWDKDRDGKPDPGFALDCYQCVMPPVTEPQCQDGEPGPCDSHACDEEKEECLEHTETYGARELICHTCGPKEEIVSFCEDCGFTSDSRCGGQCKQGPCVPIDVNVDSCKIIPSLETRERGSTQKCYACMKVEEIVIEYIIIIIETPYERYVLGKGAPERFKPSSVMALAKADTASGKIRNTAGELKSAADFMGSFNVGMGPMGLASPGKIGMDQLTGLLGKGLGSGGSYGANCFEEAAQAADANVAGGAGAPETGGSKKGKSSKEKKEKEALSEEAMKAADSVGNPAVSGPVLACGNESGNKVLKIYSAGGVLIDTITQQAFKLNPNIILEKMGVAQQLSDAFVLKSGIDIAGYVEKFTGLPLKQIQSTVAQVAQVKAQADQVIGRAAASKKGKKPQAEEAAPVVPNDPLYQAAPQEQKGKLLGVLGSTKKPAKVILGSGMRMGSDIIGGGSGQEKERPEINDQYALREIGYLPMTDPNSAWNVVDANQKNIVVAVVDSGLDRTHPDGPQYIWTNPKEVPGNGIDDDQDGFVDDVNGWNFLDERPDFTDVRGHGTFVAGIIAAKYDNGIGIAGINPGAVIMPVKVADEEGVTDSLSIYRGINYAVDHGAKVINVSLGSPSVSKLEQQAVERAHALGALVVIAAGNSNESLVAFGPASSKHGLAVGQLDYSGARSTVSNWGPNLGLVAPGEQIYSLCSKDNKHVLPSILKTGYYKQDGTSFSTPMVAATASLLWAKDPSLTNREVVDILLATAADRGEPGWDAMTGAGRLDAAAALRAGVGPSVTVFFSNIRVNRDERGKAVSVDLYGTVRGRVKEFTLEAGKGKNASRFETVAGPYQNEVDYGHISRLSVQESLRGSDEWVLRIKAIDDNGAEHLATTPFTLPK